MLRRVIISDASERFQSDLKECEQIFLYYSPFTKNKSFNNYILNFIIKDGILKHISWFRYKISCTYFYMRYRKIFPDFKLEFANAATFKWITMKLLLKFNKKL